MKGSWINKKERLRIYGVALTKPLSIITNLTPSTIYITAPEHQKSPIPSSGKHSKSI